MPHKNMQMVNEPRRKDDQEDDMPKEQLNGAGIVIKALQDQGVEVVFGYPGGAVLPIYDEIFKQNKLRHILVRQEGGAVHAAEGYARSTGKVGCVLVTSGPGATNAVTGLLDAMLDSVPLVCLCGQVPTHLIGNDAFQEADTTGITRPCTKHNYLVKDIEDLPRVMHEAFYVAQTGRPGPVVIDLPKDILMQLGKYEAPTKVTHKSYNPQVKGDTAAIARAVKMLAKAKKPIIYAGGGVINSGPGACKLLAKLTQMTGFPITLTLMGLGAYPGTDDQFLGMLGMHGTYEANMAMHDCDVMLCIGARFDDRITGRLDAFSPNSKKIHIDIDLSSINKSVMVDLPIIGDVGYVLEDMLKIWNASQSKVDEKGLAQWWKQIAEWRAKDCLAYKKDDKVIKPQLAIERLQALTKDRKDVFVTTEVGQHQMWAAQYLKFEEPQHWMTSGGLGTMGYGLPAAMGVQVAHPDALVVDISGEASVMMNIQELSTIAQYGLPVKVFILNNQYMGMVRQWQELLHGKRYSESFTGAGMPDFVMLAESFGLKGMRVTDPAKLDDAIIEMIETDTSVVLEIAVTPEENCYPMIPSGSAHNEMIFGTDVKTEGAIAEDGMVLV